MRALIPKPKQAQAANSANRAISKKEMPAQEQEATPEISSLFTSAFEHDFSHIPLNTNTPLWIQPKLKINASGDVYEQEADSIAEQVMRMPEAKLQKKSCACGAQCAKCKTDESHQLQRQLQTEGIQPNPDNQTLAPPVVYEALRSTGQSLDFATRAFFEPRFGYDFSHVRVHTNEKAAESAQAVNAQAYTVDRNIVFAKGFYQPDSISGRWLIAHELAHVAQQDTNLHLRGAAIQRKEEDKKDSTDGNPATAKAKPGTAASAPKLDLSPSKNGDACACLVVVHNDERNARKTAELMHEHCAYNLTLVSPDTGDRLIKIPGQAGMVDPNSLFPPDIAKECMDDEKSCRDFLTTKATSKTQTEIDKFVKVQFFLTISDCSKSFSIPVVGLHNNDIEDTKEYLKQKDAKGVDDLKRDIDKTQQTDSEKEAGKEAGTEQGQKLKDDLKKKFNKGIKDSLTERKGKTNIFRWCVSPDLAKCHIGDPHHPDNVIWVTNEKDYDSLSRKDVNVVLQADLAKTKGSESEGDLSTLFLVLKGLIGDRFEQVIIKLWQDIDVDFKEIDQLLDALDKLEKSGELTIYEEILKGYEIFKELLDIVILLIEVLAEQARKTTALNKLRYLNIEGPGKALKDQSDAERIRNYEAIVETLKAVDLHCCGEDPASAESKIKEGLKIDEMKEKKRKEKAKK
jgi:hypothetical protein